MRTKSPYDNIPDFENLYNVTKDFILEHQGEKGYINTNNDCDDTIYSVEIISEPGYYEDFKIYGVRVRNDEIEIFSDVNNDSICPYEEDYQDDESWEELRYIDGYYIQTLLNIAELIECYID